MLDLALHLGGLHSVEWYALAGLTLALVVLLAARRDRRHSGHPR
ncbi:MAG: hypothetical protein ACRDOY_00700 [Nocardioidaceae bacterium]